MVLAVQPKPRHTIHHKKRHGQHHKSSKHYGKAYWPYLPMLLIVGIGFIINTTWSAGSAVLGYATNVSPATLLQETNIQRDQFGKNALTMNNKLSAAAQAKANDMVAKNYWSHVGPDGTQPWQFILTTGYSYINAGENLAYGFDSSAAAVVGWMNSPGHRANVLHADYREVGFGIANGRSYNGDGEQTVIVAMYGNPQHVVTPDSARTGAAPIVSATVDEQPAPLAPTTQSGDTLVSADGHVMQAKEVSRVDMLMQGTAGWATLIAALVMGIGAVVFFWRHARLWHKLLIRGEQFIMHHPVYDITIVALVVVGFVLTRTTGFIQ